MVSKVSPCLEKQQKKNSAFTAVGTQIFIGKYLASEADFLHYSEHLKVFLNSSTGFSYKEKKANGLEQTRRSLSTELRTPSPSA